MFEVDVVDGRMTNEQEELSVGKIQVGSAGFQTSLRGPRVK